MIVRLDDEGWVDGWDGRSNLKLGGGGVLSGMQKHTRKDLP